MPRDKKEIRNTLAQCHAVDFSADFHTLGSAKVEALVEAAKAFGYRAPKNANGSTARYFFAYLNRTPKTELQHIVQSNHGHGWADVDCSLSYKEAKASLATYRANDKAAHRLIKRRAAI